MNEREPEYHDVTELCQLHGIELRGADGQPYCCGVRMRVRSGILGPDYAECDTCGKAIANMASPHICGGFMSDEWIQMQGKKTWFRIRPKEVEK